MNNIFAVYKRELKSYFVSPIFYILASVFLIITGNAFKDTFFRFASDTMRLLRLAQNYGGRIQLINVNACVSGLFSIMNFILLLIVPLLTMRLYAEEKRNGTMELLMTSPITTTEVLFGKFLSCLSIYFFMVACTIVFNILMMFYSKGNLDWGLVLTGYMGTLLLGTAIIPIGMFFSSLTENQIVAAALTTTFILGMWLLIFTANFLQPPLKFFIMYFSLNFHLDSFSVGYLVIKHIVYYLSVSTFFLFITGISVESTRWRQ